MNRNDPKIVQPGEKPKVEEKGEVKAKQPQPKGPTNQVEFNKFYQYLFGEWANLEAGLGRNDSKEVKDAKKAAKTNEIQALFNNYKSNEKFRAFLRAENNANLESILFGNTTDELKSTYHLNPKDILKHFEHLESEHSLFKNNKNEAAKKFVKIFKVCKFIADFIEKNNDDKDTVAAQHAYKILAAFGDNFKKLDTYLNTNNFIINKKHSAPLHDALLFNLPKDSDKFDLSAWQALISKFGPKMAHLFNNAPTIEVILGGENNRRTPKDLNEAEEALKKINLKNAHEYPELAKLCIEYKVSEEIFEKCLTVKARRKEHDNLPSATIKEGNYWFVKLPLDDPHAYLLGEVTNCCQSIGKHSEKCVIDGITRPNNGFYVLLRGKSRASSDQKTPDNKTDSPFDKHGKIDYKKVEIVGQGYAWMSTHGNLTLDSWENRTPERDDRVAFEMLKKFGEQVVGDKNRGILRVTIGEGGKTPKELFRGMGCAYPEKILEGFQYGDSANQFTIYADDKAQNEIVTTMKNVLEAEVKKILSSPDSSDSLKDNLNRLINNIIQPKQYITKQYFQSLGYMDTAIALLHFQKQLDMEIKKITSDQTTSEVFKSNFGLLMEEMTAHPKQFLEQHYDKSIQDMKNAIVMLNSPTLKYILSQENFSQRLPSITWQDLAKVIQRGFITPEFWEKIFKLPFLHTQFRRAWQKEESYLRRGFGLINDLSYLSKNQIENDPEVMKFLLENEDDNMDYGQSFARLHENKLDTIPIVRKYMFSNPHAAEGFIELYKNKMDNRQEYPEIWDLIDNNLFRYSTPQIAKAILPRLKTLGFEDQKDLCIALLQCRDIQLAEGMLEVYKKYKAINMEKDPLLRDWLFKQTGNGNLQNDTTYFFHNVNRLIKLNLHHEKVYIKFIHNFTMRGVDLVDALEVLAKYNLQLDPNFIKEVETWQSVDFKKIANKLIAEKGQVKPIQPKPLEIKEDKGKFEAIKAKDFVVTEGTDTYVNLGQTKRTLALPKEQRHQFFKHHDLVKPLLLQNALNPILREDTSREDPEGEFFFPEVAFKLLIHYKIMQHIQKPDGLPYDTKNLFIVDNSQRTLENILTNLNLKEGEDAKFVFIDGIHVIPFYVRRDKDGMKCFVIDPEPGKDIAVSPTLHQALKNVFDGENNPPIKIHASKTKLQLDFFSCSTFGLKSLMYFVKHGQEIFPYLDNLEKKGNIGTRDGVQIIPDELLMPPLLKMCQTMSVRSAITAPLYPLLSQEAKDTVVSHKHKIKLSDYLVKHTTEIEGKPYNIRAIDLKYKAFEFLNNCLQKDLNPKEREELLSGKIPEKLQKIADNFEKSPSLPGIAPDRKA